MKKTFAVAASFLIAWVVAAESVCVPLRPAPGALEARMAAVNAHPMMQSAQAAETQLDVVDVLIAFDQSAVRWIAANDKGSPAGYAAKCVEKLNYCLQQSHLLNYFHFRLAGTVVLAKDAASMSLINVVLSMVNEYGEVVATGEWKKVTDARESLGADIVTVMTACGAYGNVGQGFSLESDWGGRSGAAIKAFGDWAYNACAIEAVDNGYSQMHEIGHNMGCGHPDDAMAPGLAAMSTLGYKATGPQFYDYSSGWYLWDSGTGYYTVMSYNWGGVGADGSYNSRTRFQPLPYLSNPIYTWKGHALGDSRHDNRRTLINTYKYVAQYRISQLSDGKVHAEPEVPERSGNVVSTKASGPVSGLSLARAAEVGGCVLDGEGRPTASVSLKIGKAGKRGTRVSGSVTPFTTGKRVNSKSVTVDLSQGPQTLTFELKNLGTLSVKLGLNAAGKVEYSGSLGGEQVSSAGVGDGSLTGRKVFTKPAVPAVVKDVAVNSDYLPNNEPVDMQGRKWVLAKAASIAYKKDKATGLKRWFVNNGWVDHKKTNLSGLKLAYKPQDGSFKGSFTIYGLHNDRLKKIKAEVRGVVLDGEGHGVVVVKGVDDIWQIDLK